MKIRSWELFRFYVRPFQCFLKLFDFGLIGLDITNIPALFESDDDLPTIPGWYCIELGFLVGTLTINIDHPKK